MSKLLEKLTKGSMSRREFLKGSATATMAAAGLSLLGGNSTRIKEVRAEEETSVEHPAITDPEMEGKWITAACWHNCGGRCLNKALVVDGIVVRQKTDDTHPDSPDFPQQRACVRGRAQRNQVFSADRLLCPIKRKNWSPEDPHPELRGHDEWERITWDEALDYAAAEIKKAIENYGNQSIMARSSEVSRLLNLLGGYVRCWGTTSRGAYTLTPGIVGFPQDTGNDRFDNRNCDTVIMWSMNPGWSSAGNPIYHWMQVKKAGAKIYAVDPYYNESYNVLGAQWVPCRPSMDTAMLLGVAYEMLKLEEEQGDIIDWDFLHKYTVGFDAESMPEDATTDENFMGYVLGEYDGIPKTAEWASELCGASVEDIKNLAWELRKGPKVALVNCCANGRTCNNDNLPQLFMTVACMGGHTGSSGQMFGTIYHTRGGNVGYSLVTSGGTGVPGISNVLDEAINDTEAWNACLTGKYNYTGGSARAGISEIRDIDIHVMIHGASASLSTRDSGAKAVQAHKTKFDFVLSLSQFMRPEAMYADIVLPANTHWERPGHVLTGNREILIFAQQICESLGESHSDQWIAKELAKRFDIDPMEVYPISEKAQFFNSLVGCKVVNPEDGHTMETLITITQEDIDEWGVADELAAIGIELAPQEGRIGLKEILEQGIYQVERYQGDPYTHITMKDFIDDPEANPVNTNSGKLEIYSQKLADTVNGCGWSEIKPYPTYIPAKEGWEATQNSDFPFQLYNPHYLRRSHATLDNVQWLRETWPNPVFLNASDAAAKGIADGDTVLITSPHGKTLRFAYTTERVIPGVVGLPHGCWMDIDEETGIDLGGSDNYLTGTDSTGQGVSGWNTAICNYEKYEGDLVLLPDVEKPMRIVVEF